MIINSRTFKTFDALLDSLSKRVPLPFGVRNITTPRGIHGISTLDELEDRKAYICSDQKKVKPIDLAVASKPSKPWNSTRPVSAHRRAIQLNNKGQLFQRKNSVVVRTPRKIVVFKNGDAGIKHTLMLQKKTTQTFESILDLVTEVMQFRVLKLYTPDGRRVDGLQALILCSGVVVAAGREPFKARKYDTQRLSLPTKLPGISNRVKPKPINKIQQRNYTPDDNKALLETSMSTNNIETDDTFDMQELIERLGMSDEVQKESCAMMKDNSATCLEEQLVNTGELSDVPVPIEEDENELAFECNEKVSLCLKMDEVPDEENATLGNTSYSDKNVTSDQNVPNDNLQVSEAEDTTEVSPRSTEQNVISGFMVENQEGSINGTNEHLSVNEDTLEEEDGVNPTHYVCDIVKPCDDTMESTNSHSSASSLAFGYDAKQNPKMEFGGISINALKEMFMAKSIQDFQYGSKRLPRPLTSNLSDCRPESSESVKSGYKSQASCEMTTKSGEDGSGKRSVSTGYVIRTIERLYGKTEANFRPPSFKRPPSVPKQKQKESPSKMSAGSITSFEESKPKVNGDLLYFHAKGSFHLEEETLQGVQNTAQSETDDGVLIDKGRWLLKDNHLIRKSPPENIGMYGNIETTSTETALDNTSEDVPYSRFASHLPPLAVISSSELEELAKSTEPKCSYFNVPRASDSDPFQDDLLNVNSKGSLLCNDSPRKKKKGDRLSMATCAEPEQKWAERNCSLPSFALVDFRIPNNKVHPEQKPPVAHAVVAQPSRANSANSKAPEDQHSLEKLHLMCGQHCPILTVTVEPLNEEKRGYVYQKQTDPENQWIMRSLTRKTTALYQHAPQMSINDQMSTMQVNEENMTCIMSGIIKMFENESIKHEIERIKQGLSLHVSKKQVM
ncbi:UNVERIFIED_CONTAM: hypothetical protein FKN15_078397 [Acipenser sinensis]